MEQKLDEINTEIKAINLRYFGLEGKFAKFEERMDAKSEALKSLMEAQKIDNMRISKVEIKIAYYTGMGVVIGVLASTLLSKVLSLIKL